VTWPKKIADAIEERSGGVCEGCRKRPATDKHHRKYKSRGGKDELINALHLCGGANGLPGGNHSGCHGIAHSKRGHELGWSVNSWDDPAEIPVQRLDT